MRQAEITHNVPRVPIAAYTAGEGAVSGNPSPPCTSIMRLQHRGRRAHVRCLAALAALTKINLACGPSEMTRCGAPSYHYAPSTALVIAANDAGPP
jgi:hypothetical protein